MSATGMSNFCNREASCWASACWGRGADAAGFFSSPWVAILVGWMNVVNVVNVKNVVNVVNVGNMVNVVNFGMT